MEKRVSLINGVVKKKKMASHMQKNETTSLSYTIYKNKPNWIKDFNVRPETIKLLEHR